FDHQCSNFAPDITSPMNSFGVKNFIKTVIKESLSVSLSFLDQDRSGYIEQGELQLKLCEGARPLTPADTRAFLLEGDLDGDGEIGWEGQCV
uniref:EF-hand domain-containing protein n=1 Tax=Maylandia zebra TaxID=106582 RepID=A0A3P9BNB9_9CICH